MEPERCLYAILHAPRDRHEALLHELVAPVALELRDRPELDSLFFARYSIPDWQVRFRVLGRPAWVDGTVRELMERRLNAPRDERLVDSWEFTTYQREYERYGGEEGMRIAEEVFHHDSLLCLDLLEVERRGLLSKSRREFSLLLTERFLDLLRFEGERRIAFYVRGYGWAIDAGEWSAEDVESVERRFHDLREGLEELLESARRDPPAEVWGGAEPARIAERWVEATRPAIDRLLDAHDAGRIPQDLVYIAWSLSHMHCNRLGIDATPEAILRYFMHRLHDNPG